MELSIPFLGFHSRKKEKLQMSGHTGCFSQITPRQLYESGLPDDKFRGFATVLNDDSGNELRLDIYTGREQSKSEIVPPSLCLSFNFAYGKGETSSLDIPLSRAIAYMQTFLSSVNLLNRSLIHFGKFTLQINGDDFDIEATMRQVEDGGEEYQSLQLQQNVANYVERLKVYRLIPTGQTFAYFNDLTDEQLELSNLPVTSWRE